FALRVKVALLRSIIELEYVGILEAAGHSPEVVGMKQLVQKDRFLRGDHPIADLHAGIIAVKVAAVPVALLHEDLLASKKTKHLRLGAAVRGNIDLMLD